MLFIIIHDMIEIFKENGEYVIKVPEDTWINRILPTLMDNEDLKTIILENYTSSNKNFFETKSINFVKKNNLILVDGKNLDYISHDNVFEGKIHVVSQNFSSLVQKSNIPPISSLPVDFSIEIEKKHIKIRYRNFMYTSKAIAFFILRNFGIIPSEFHIDSIHHNLTGIIPQNTSYVKIELVKYSKYILPHKIIFSIVVSYDDNKYYYTLTLSKNKWKIQSTNTQKGCLNFFHKFLVKSREKIITKYENLKLKISLFGKLSKSIENIVKTMKSNSFIRIPLEVLSIAILVFLAMKLRIIFTLLLLLVAYVLLRRIFLYINFNRRIV